MKVDDKPAGSGIAAKCMEAMELFRQYRAAGMDFEEAVKLLEAGLREAIPARQDDRSFPPECARCSGTGWKPVDVWQRIYQAMGRAVTYCDCSKGQMFKAANERQASAPARVRHGWARVGQR